MRYTQDGKAVTTLSVASNRTYTANGERVKETTWFRVSVWGAQAESCNQYLKKGSSVLVEGELRPDKETGGPRVYQLKDGTHGASYEVTARTVRFLSGGGNSEPAEDDGDIPF